MQFTVAQLAVRCTQICFVLVRALAACTVYRTQCHSTLYFALFCPADTMLFAHFTVTSCVLNNLVGNQLTIELVQMTKSHEIHSTRANFDLVYPHRTF